MGKGGDTTKTSIANKSSSVKGGGTMTFKAVRDLPHRQANEYDTFVFHPTPDDVQLTFRETAKCEASFDKYIPLADGSPSPAEYHQVIRNRGDILVAVNGTLTEGKSFDAITKLFEESRTTQATTYLRFRDINPSFEIQELQLQNEIRYHEQEIAHHQMVVSKSRDEIARLEAVVKRSEEMIEKHEDDLDKKRSNLDEVQDDHIKSKKEEATKLEQKKLPVKPKGWLY